MNLFLIKFFLLLVMVLLFMKGENPECPDQWSFKESRRDKGYIKRKKETFWNTKYIIFY